MNLRTKTWTLSVNVVTALLYRKSQLECDTLRQLVLLYYYLLPQKSFSQQIEKISYSYKAKNVLSLSRLGIQDVYRYKTI